MKRTNAVFPETSGIRIWENTWRGAQAFRRTNGRQRRKPGASNWRVAQNNNLTQKRRAFCLQALRELPRRSSCASSKRTTPEKTALVPHRRGFFASWNVIIGERNTGQQKNRGAHYVFRGFCSCWGSGCYQLTGLCYGTGKKGRASLTSCRPCLPFRPCRPCPAYHRHRRFPS